MNEKVNISDLFRKRNTVYSNGLSYVISYNPGKDEELLEKLHNLNDEKEVIIECERVNMDFINKAHKILGNRLRIRPMYSQERIRDNGNKYYPVYTYEKIVESEKVLDMYAKTVEDYYDKDGDLKSLSPLEKFIAAWILTTKFAMPKEEDEPETLKNYHTSRGVYEFIDKVTDRRIVCVGYVNLLMEILYRMGITRTAYVEYCFPEIEGKETPAGHVRMLVDLLDKKHKINNLFMCDPTFDAEQTFKVNNGLSNYSTKYMLMSREEIEKNNPGGYMDIDITKGSFGKNNVLNWHFFGQIYGVYSAESRFHTPIPKETIIYAFLAVERFLDKNKKMVKRKSEYTIEEFNEMAHRLGLDEYMKKRKSKK